MDSMAKKILFFVFLAWVLDAADSTIYSLTLPMIKNEFGLDLKTMGMIASVFLAGTVLGSLLLPVLADRRGRRIGMVACVGLFSVFTGIVGMAGNAVTVAVGRFLTGCGTGAEWPIGAAYLSEVVTAKRRGFAMGIMQAGYPVGFFLAGFVFLVLTSWLGLGWRACYVFLTIPGLIICIPIVTLLTESPTWLKTRAERAAVARSGRSAAVRVGYAGLFSGQYIRGTLIATGLHVFGAIYAYGVVVWLPSALVIDFGLDTKSLSYFTMFSWGVGTIGYLLAGRMADRFGRKTTLAIYMLIGLIAIIILNLLHISHERNVAYLLVPGAMIGISVGVTVTYITYSSEIYPARIRTVGLGFSVAIGKVMAVFIPTVLGIIAELSSVSAALLVSTVLGVLMIPIIMLGPETAGRNLEDIAGDAPPRPRSMLPGDAADVAGSTKSTT